MRSLVFAAVLLAAPSAMAQQAPNPQLGAVRQACATDLQRYCSGVQPGGGRIAQCLQQNASSLSEACRSALIAARAARR